MTTEERISRLEGIYEQVDGRLSDLTLSVNSLRIEMDSLRSQMIQANEALRAEMIQANEALRAEMNKRFNNLYVLLGGAWITVMGALIGLILTV
jgi:ABC-type phosphate transport system auxiliary subunit